MYRGLIILLLWAFWPDGSFGQLSVRIGPDIEVGGDGVTLNVTGEWIEQGTFRPGRGAVVFSGFGMQTIRKESRSVFHDLTIRKPAGDVHLTEEVLVTGALDVIRGEVRLNGYRLGLGNSGRLVEAGNFRVQGGLGYVSVRRQIAGANEEDIGGLGFIVNTRGRIGDMLVTRGHTARTVSGFTAVNRYYYVEAQRVSNADVTLRLRYALSELNGIRETDMGVFRSRDGGITWDFEGGEVNAADDLVTVTTRDLSGLWTIADRRASMPVRITAFDVNVNRNNAQVTWTSSGEASVEGYEVQVSYRGIEDYRTVGFVDSRGTGLHSYSFEVEDLSPGRHRFRVRPRLSSGTSDVEMEQEATVESRGIFALSEPYPNPFNPSTSVTLTLTSHQHVRIEVYDLQGRRVDQLHDGPLTSHETHRFTFEAGNLPSSVYMFRVTGETFSATRRVMLVK